MHNKIVTNLSGHTRVYYTEEVIVIGRRSFENDKYKNVVGNLLWKACIGPYVLSRYPRGWLTKRNEMVTTCGYMHKE